MSELGSAASGAPDGGLESLFADAPSSVLWQSPRPNANGHFWRIWSHGHVEVLPSGWIPGNPDPGGSLWLTHERLTTAAEADQVGTTTQ